MIEMNFKKEFGCTQGRNRGQGGPGSSKKKKHFSSLLQIYNFNPKTRRF